MLDKKYSITITYEEESVGSATIRGFVEYSFETREIPVIHVPDNECAFCGKFTKNFGCELISWNMTNQWELKNEVHTEFPICKECSAILSKYRRIKAKCKRYYSDAFLNGAFVFFFSLLLISVHWTIPFILTTMVILYYLYKESKKPILEEQPEYDEVIKNFNKLHKIEIKAISDTQVIVESTNEKLIKGIESLIGNYERDYKIRTCPKCKTQYNFDAQYCNICETDLPRRRFWQRGQPYKIR